MEEKAVNKNSGWHRVLLIIIPFIFFVGIFQLIGYLLLGINLSQINPDAKLSSFQEAFISFMGLIGTFFLLWLFMTFIDKEKFINLGFKLKNRFIDVIAGILVGGIVMSCGYLLLVQLKEINFERIVFNFEEIVFSILLFLFVALTEEVLFRGYVLKNLMFSFNKYVALLLSAVLFALMHGLNPNMSILGMTNLFLAGLLLGISYIYTKNLWFPIALHLSWNFFQSMFGFNVSGQDSYSLIEYSVSENNLLNGGDFGFEGSILSVVFEIAFILLIWLYYTQNLKKAANY